MGLLGEIRRRTMNSPLLRPKRRKRQRLAMISLEDVDDDDAAHGKGVSSASSTSSTADISTTVSSVDSFDELVTSRGCSFEVLPSIHHDLDSSLETSTSFEDSGDEEITQREDILRRSEDTVDVDGPTPRMLLLPSATVPTFGFFDEDTMEVQLIPDEELSIRYPDPDVTAFISDSSSSDEDDETRIISKRQQDQQLEGMMIDARKKDSVAHKRDSIFVESPMKAIGRRHRRRKSKMFHIFHNQLSPLYEEEVEETIRRPAATAAAAVTAGRSLSGGYVGGVSTSWADDLNIRARWEYALEVMLGSSCTEPELKRVVVMKSDESEEESDDSDDAMQMAEI